MWANMNLLLLPSKINTIIASIKTKKYFFSQQILC